MQSLAKNLFYILAGLLAMAGCKKGEDDPAISFRTRTARLTGDWKLKEGYLTVLVKDSAKADAIYEYGFGDNRYELIAPNSQTFLGTQELGISITKNGAVEITQTQGGSKLKATGSWDFEDGTGKNNKNKERVYFQISSVSEGTSIWYWSFNKSNINFTYRIKELRNKRMVLVTEEETVYSTSKSAYIVTAAYTFTQ